MTAPTININDFKELETPVRYVVEIRIRYWRDRYGNAYCAGRLLVNGATVHVEPMCYSSCTQLTDTLCEYLNLEPYHKDRIASGVWLSVDYREGLRRDVKRFGEW
jgi:hypothetical protein